MYYNPDKDQSEKFGWRKVCYQQTLYYDPDKDQSEKFGWRKVCYQQTPTQSEQNFWSGVYILFAVVVNILMLAFF
jgi:hypothetical protein